MDEVKFGFFFHENRAEGRYEEKKEKGELKSWKSYAGTKEKDSDLVVAKIPEG